jgi:ribosomal protein S27AE
MTMSTKLIERGARIRRTKWVELSCLLCGEAVATLEGGSVLRPHTDSSVRVNGTRVTCGRCGGSLGPTDQGERVHFV